MTFAPNSPNGLKILKCAVLSTWSHTLGPQVVFTWSPSGESGPGAELSQLTAHLLYSDILANSDKHPCCIRCKVLVLPKHEVVLQSRVFRAVEWQQLECPLALTLVYGISQLDRVWNICRVTEVTLTRMVKTIRKCKNPAVGAALVQKKMDQLCLLLDRLYGSQDNLHGSQDNLPSELALSKCNIRWNSLFVIKSLVSHLQTSGRTVVIGTNELHLSKLPEFLLYFLLEDERCCSVPSVPREEWKFSHGAHLQTLRKESYETPEDLFQELKVYSKIPTVIDLDNLKVKQIQEQTDESQSELPRTRNQLKNITEVGTMVPEFMELLQLADPDEIGYIFRRHLLLKAALSAKMIQASCPKNNQLKRMLGVTEDADLNIVFGYMNKIWPRHS